MLAILASCIVNAQDKAENVCNYSNGLGMGAGFTTGYGIQYRHFFPNKFGVQGSFAPYKDDNETIISLGLTLMYRLAETERTNFFLYQGTHYYYDKRKEFNYYYSGYSYDYNSFSNKIDNYFNVGAGIGIEISIFKRIGLNLMCGYAGYENFNTISMTGEIGTYFYF